MRGFVEFEAPMRATIESLPVLVIGVLGDTRLLCIDLEGYAKDAVIETVRFDYRFDLDKREWSLVGPMKPDG